MSVASYSHAVSQPAQESLLYVDYSGPFENDPPVAASRQTYAPTPTKAEMAFQNAIYGYGDNGSEVVAPFQSYASTPTYDASTAIPQLPAIAQYTTQGLHYDVDALTMPMQESYGYAYNTDLYNSQYGAPLELYDAETRA
jgi:hypothetical protein